MELLDIRETRRVVIDATELRTSGSDLTFEGYASLFDSPYPVHGGPESGGWTETVDARAFDRTLKTSPDVVFLVNHDGLPLARTTSGTMSLATDSTGLKVRASFDPSNPRVSELASGMRRGDVSQMSCAFRTKRNEWTNEDTERRLLEVSLDRGDVSAVTNGANPSTSSSLRSLLTEDELRGLSPDELREAHARIGGLLRPSRATMTVSAAERLLLL